MTIKAYFLYKRNILCIFCFNCFFFVKNACVVLTIIPITKRVSADVIGIVHTRVLYLAILFTRMKYSGILVSVSYTFVYQNHTFCVVFVMCPNDFKYAKVTLTKTKKSALYV